MQFVTGPIGIQFYLVRSCRMSFSNLNEKDTFQEKVEFLINKYKTEEDPVAIDKEWDAFEQAGLVKTPPSITPVTQAECTGACSKTERECDKECKLDASCLFCTSSVKDDGIGVYLLSGHDADIHKGGDICHACITTFVLGNSPVNLKCYHGGCATKIGIPQLQGILHPVLLQDFKNRKLALEANLPNERSSTASYSSYANILLTKPNSQGKYNAYRSKQKQKELELQEEEKTLGTNAKRKENHKQKSDQLQQNLSRERNSIVKCFELCPACLYIQDLKPSEFVCGYSYTHKCIKNKLSPTIATLYPGSFNEEKGLTYYCMVCGRPAYKDRSGGMKHYPVFNGKLEEQPKEPGQCGLMQEKLARLIQLQTTMAAQQAEKKNTNAAESVDERAVALAFASIDPKRLKQADAILAQYPYLHECSNETSALTQALEMSEQDAKKACASGAAGAGAGSNGGGRNRNRNRKGMTKKTRKLRKPEHSRKQTRTRR